MCRIWWGIVPFVVCSNHAAWGQSNVDKELAPTGKFRVGMNANNATLVKRNANGNVDVYASSINTVLRMAERLPGAKVVGTSHTVPFAAAMQRSERPTRPCRTARAGEAR
jgi:hypothetical protein